jgi:hypothetical protein
MPDGPQLVETYNDEIVYNIMINLPNNSLIPANDKPAPLPIVMQHDVALGAPTAAATEVKCQYPTRSCRSVLGMQPYDAYAPQVQLLQLGEVQAHRSALAAMTETKTSSAGDNEQMHATTSVPKINNTVHTANKKKTMTHIHEVAVWRYLMTQYNLKARLRKFEEKMAKAAVTKLMQLHVMCCKD